MPVEESLKTEGDSSDSVEYPSDDETSTYERRILKLKRRRVRAFFSEFKDGVVKASDLLPKPSPPQSPDTKKRIHKKRYSTPVVAFQPRKSTRLSTKSQLEVPSPPPPPPVKKPKRRRRGPYKKRFAIPLVTFQPLKSTTLSTKHQLKMPSPPSSSIGRPRRGRPSKKLFATPLMTFQTHNSARLPTKLQSKMPSPPPSPVIKPKRGRPFKKLFATPLMTFQPLESARLSTESQLKMPSPPPSPVLRSRSGRPLKNRFAPLVTFQPRKSARLSTKKVDYEGLDEDFEEPRAYRRRSVGVRMFRTRRFRLEERIVEFNPDALSGTVCYNSHKVYSQSGTTCHQCRQKTIDLKSRCYSPYCRGMRGMFCGHCLLKRYGEDVSVVLRDPKWTCPPCRKICNCSICRRSFGKEPTGQLFTCVNEKGYNNVLEYLSKIGDDKLEDFEADDEFEEGDEKDEENQPPVKRNPNSKSKIGNEPIVKLKRLDLSFDEEGNLLTSFKGF